ncbi:transmembrane protein, putative [Medicago truncatula]|uniref:Transmembrane protein, putative n=1 Tax=Medicago truncatula TaxID=3880 RepID=G7KL30_MEDTR|nr:transmembrane protein, putative [Medicago truncatula]
MTESERGNSKETRGKKKRGKEGKKKRRKEGENKCKKIYVLGNSECDNCKTSIFDYHRSCKECSFNICLLCCCEQNRLRKEENSYFICLWCYFCFTSVHCIMFY